MEMHLANFNCLHFLFSNTAAQSQTCYLGYVTRQLLGPTWFHNLT